MLLGSSTSHKLQLVYSAATAVDLEVSGSKVVVSTASPPIVDGTNTAPFVLASLTTAGGATADLVAGIASTITRISECTVRNKQATYANSVTVRRTDGAQTTDGMTVNLLPGETLAYDGQVWEHKDATGASYASIGIPATQTEAEAGASNTVFLTPLAANWHPGVAKFWLRAGVAADITASWNITSLTDTGTGVMAITIATDFSSSTGYCCQVSVEATATTWAVANTRECHIRSATLAAGTVSVDCIDNTATTSLVKDPSSWHVVGYGDQA